MQRGLSKNIDLELALVKALDLSVIMTFGTRPIAGQADRVQLAYLLFGNTPMS